MEVNLGSEISPKMVLNNLRRMVGVHFNLVGSIFQIGGEVGFGSDTAAAKPRNFLSPYDADEQVADFREIHPMVEWN